MLGHWRKALIVGTVLVATHAASALYYANRYASGIVRTPSRAMTLDLTFDEWSTAAAGADSTTYLNVAQNVAAGKGVVATIPGSNPRRVEPFLYWGPGAPVVLGWWLKLVGGRTMFSFFMFAVVAQLIAGALAVATAAQWTRSTIALSIVAFCSGFCPPLQDWFYGVHLTSSEVVALPILALMFFALSNGFLAWTDQRMEHADQAGAAASRFQRLWRRLLPDDLNRQVWFWFALAGVLIGCASLSRDCVRVFAPFIATFLALRAAAVDRRRFWAAIAVGVVVLAGTRAIRFPVQLWNKHRVHRSTVCVASEGCIWRYGLWMKHDDAEWYKSAGIGFGEYLDPAAALRVDESYKSGRRNADFYSQTQLLQAVWNHPAKALAFKVERLPVLWLDTDMWPNSALTSSSVWCIVMYAMLALFCIRQRRRRQAIPEVLYLYFFLILFASTVIHFEFRYTFPIWNTLIMVPGLLYATLTRQGLQPRLADTTNFWSGAIRQLHVVRKLCPRPMVLLAILLVAHFCSRLALHSESPLSAAHNYERAYGISLSLLAGRGFEDIAVDDSPASAPIREFFDLKRSCVSRDEFDAFLASKPEPARGTHFGEYLPLASTRVADIRIAAELWQVFGIDRRVLAAFYCLFSTATCGAVFLIARRLTGSAWAGLAAAALLTISPIEGFLNTWSWRDASPMWFTALALAWFVCGLERSRRPAVNCAAYLLLGALAMVGIGWRIDALLLVPFFAGAVIIRLIAARVGWRYFLAAASCFVAGALGTRAAISAMGSEQPQTSNIGFHMAFYGDFSRSRMLGIENSFQALFSDMQTLDTARQFNEADHPDAEPLRYMSPEYGDVCRRMFLEQLDYNAFQWIFRFPKFFFHSLSRLDSQSMNGEAGSRLIQADLSSPLSQAFWCGDWLENAMPFLFLIGVLATTCVGREKLSAMLLALFSVYYSGIMLLVLPDEKHIGMLLVPMYVFAGAGIWAIARLVARRAWHADNRAVWLAHAWRVGKVLALSAAAWGLTCIWAHAHSAARREELLSEIRERAAEGIDAPETLRGERNFAVSIRPDSLAKPAGYLLTISAGDHPGTLTCRQVYFPRDWAHLWGRELITRHRLYPNREQSFFVSCLQGPRVGDPCPLLCSIAIDGDARISRSTQVAMVGWRHPQFGTVFYDGQRSPGSPAVAGSATDWLYVGQRPLADLSPDVLQINRSGMSETMAPLPAAHSAGRPLCHLIGRNTETGLWKIAMSDGWRFSFNDATFWSPATKWLQLQTGDFNGDGLFDLVGQSPDGRWWLATNNGAYNEFRTIDALPRDGGYDFVGVGDFNGDGLDDLILRSTDGHWTLALSCGDGFHCEPIEGLPSGTARQNIVIGHFLGTGRSQIVGLDPETGRWTIAGMEGTSWTVRPWGDFPAAVDWQHLTVGDFSGTGNAGVAAWDPKTGVWMVGRNDGARLAAKPFGKWPAGKNFRCVQSGSFGDGRHAGLAAVDVNTAELSIAVSDGTKFTTRQYPGRPEFEKRFYAGAFSGGPRDELLGVADDGQIWVGKFAADGELHFESWGHWPDAIRLTDFHPVGLWSERSPSHQAQPR